MPQRIRSVLQPHGVKVHIGEMWKVTVYLHELSQQVHIPEFSLADELNSSLMICADVLALRKVVIVFLIPLRLAAAAASSCYLASSLASFYGTKEASRP